MPYKPEAQVRERMKVTARPSLARFEVAHFLSPRGTAADSLGREPQENQNETESSPERATQGRAFTPVSPLQGLEVLFGNNSWGSRPRLSAVTASRLNSATSKLARRACNRVFAKLRSRQCVLTRQCCASVAYYCRRSQHFVDGLSQRKLHYLAVDFQQDQLRLNVDHAHLV